MKLVTTLSLFCGYHLNINREVGIVGFILTTLTEAKANGNLREESLRMAGLLGMEFNEMLEELDIAWLFE